MIIELTVLFAKASKTMESNSNEGVPPVPKRPLTAYNLFSILERNYIVQQHQKPDESDTANSELDPYASQRPARYRDLVLPSNWYVVGMNRKKRCDHKNHGVISFKDLSKSASDNWQKADSEVKAYCKMVASEELKRYRKDQAAFKEKYGEEAFYAQKKTYNKRPKEDGLDSPDGKKAHKNGESKDSEESDNESKVSPDGGTNNQAAPSALEQYFASQQFAAMHSMFGFGHMMGNNPLNHQKFGSFATLNFGLKQLAAASAIADPRNPFLQSNAKAKKEDERKSADNASGYSSDFSIGDWIASGKDIASGMDASKAFDSDDE